MTREEVEAIEIQKVVDMDGNLQYYTAINGMALQEHALTLHDKLDEIQKLVENELTNGHGEATVEALFQISDLLKRELQETP